MPHGSLLIGRVEAWSLCDGVTLASAGKESFPGVRDDAWAESERRHPWAFGKGGRWRLHVHATLLRSKGATILVDTGVGPETAPAFAWSALRGALPEELGAVGSSPAEIDVVVVTHVHDDHLGWTTEEHGDEPLFPNARYVLHRADWDLMVGADDEEGREIFAKTLSPLQAADMLQLIDGDLHLTGELAVVHAPGHTPGHQVVTIDSDGARALISGDLVNHPAQLLQTGLNGTTDADHPLAAATRAAWLERVEREDRVVVPSHFQEGFGRFVVEGDHHAWEPVQA